MKSRLWLMVIIFCLTGSLTWEITPEEARKELAQENIPYTVEALVDHIEKGDIEGRGRRERPERRQAYRPDECRPKWSYRNC